MRLAHLSADRIELQFVSKESARAMAETTTADVEALKRCIRFLLKYPRLIQSFEDKKLCPSRSRAPVSRTSPDVCRAGRARVPVKFSMGNIFWNLHQQHRRLSVSRVPNVNSTQAVKAAAVGIGCVSMMRDLGVVLQQQGVQVKAKGLGDGIDSPSFEIKLDALQCTKMTRADLGTKHLDYQTMKKHLKFCGMRFAEGWSKIAPQLEFFSTSIPTSNETSGSSHSPTPRHEQRLERGMENLVWRHSPNAQNCALAWTATSQGGVSKSGPKVRLSEFMSVGRVSSRDSVRLAVAMS